MKAIYPGTFDPVTNGHYDIIKRSAKIFDEVVVGVLINSEKTTMFSLDERIEMLNELLYDIDHIKVKSFSGLLVDFVEQEQADVVVRGLRAVTDYEYELQMALANQKLLDSFETVFLIASSQYSFLSSSLVKEIGRLGGRISDFVPPHVEKALKDKFERG